MARPKGLPKTGGRKKGSPVRRLPSDGHNPLSRNVSERLTQMGVDPIEGMARIAADKKADLGLRARMYAELAQYIYPKRKAIEHSGPDGSALAAGGTTIDARQLLRDRIAGIRERIGSGSNPPVSQ